MLKGEGRKFSCGNKSWKLLEENMCENSHKRRLKFLTKWKFFIYDGIYPFQIVVWDSLKWVKNEFLQKKSEFNKKGGKNSLRYKKRKKSYLIGYFVSFIDVICTVTRKGFKKWTMNGSFLSNGWKMTFL